MSFYIAFATNHVQWFGEPWNPHVCDPSRRTPVPVYEFCESCERPILRRDQGLIIPPGVIAHLNCHLHSIGILPCSWRYHPPTKETLS